MWIVFDILFTFVPVFIIIVIFFVAKNAKIKKDIKEDEKFKDIVDKASKSETPLTDKDIEDELVKRFNEYSQKEDAKNQENNHDITCHEGDCDGCGSQDVYDQVYGKRKKNKLKK